MGEVLRANRDVKVALWHWLEETQGWCVHRLDGREPLMLLLSQVLRPYSERDLRTLASEGMAPPYTLLIVEDEAGAATMETIEAALEAIAESLRATEEAAQAARSRL